jgi:hypothetical protein
MFAFVSLIVALISFDHFLGVFFIYRRKITADSESGQIIPDDAVCLVGYALFFWVTTFFTPPTLEHPDILVFIAYLLAATLCMQICYRPEWWRYLVLGLILGLGYLMKSVMFPLGFVFLLALLLQGGWGRFSRISLAAAAFVGTSLVFCLPLSIDRGRFTFGDVGVLAYRHVMGLDDSSLPPTDLPRPSATPHALEYKRILQLGTYPPWADPSHGFKGAPLQFRFWRQLNRTHVVLHGYFDIYVQALAALACGILILLCWDNVRLFLRRFFGQFVLWLPAAAGLTFYATMRFEPRFLAGFTVALFAACFGSLRLINSPYQPKLARSVAVAISSLLFVQAGVQAAHDGMGVFNRGPRPESQIRASLVAIRVNPGDLASYMGETLNDHGWAYVAGVKIVSEIPSEDVLGFWASDRVQKAEVLNWLVSTGSKVLVTRGVPSTATSMGWRRVGDTDYYLLPLFDASQKNN